MSTAELLSAFEPCARRGYYSRSWRPQRLSPTQMVRESMYSALRATGTQEWGDHAGGEMMALAEDRGMEVPLSHRLYDSVLHHAALADLLTTAIRKPEDPAWIQPEPVQNWTPDCLMAPDGSKLRRLVLVSSWGDERHYSECRSWYSLGNMAAYDLPMQLVVMVIGRQRDGFRQSPWTQGFLHPANRQLRFRKKSRQMYETFNDRWIKVNREDHAEILRSTWLNAMLKDDVLPEVCFRIDQPLPAPIHLQKIRDMRDAKLERLYKMKITPEGNLSTCDFPVPCPFRSCCHTIPETEPTEQLGFHLNSSLYPASPGMTP